MFKFDFRIEGNEESSTEEKELKLSSQPETECRESTEVQISNKHLNNLSIYEAFSAQYPLTNQSLLYINSVKDVYERLDFYCSFLDSDAAQADLVSGLYEGGAKIWECTQDLLNYFHPDSSTGYFHGKNVLDLGCGAGFAGILAAKFGALNVHFQDYNEDVLYNITIPTVLLNIRNSSSYLREKFKFYSGDWKKYTKFTEFGESFDIILTSETIYNLNNYKKLVDTFDQKLKSCGLIFLAAKVHYFGVGGGIKQFEEFIRNDKRFVSENVWTSTTEIPRVILKIVRSPEEIVF